MALLEASLELEGLRTDPDRAAVPKDRYLSQAFWDAENEQLWPDVWQWACLEDEVPEPGTFYEYEIGKRSFLITRAEDGKIRAFHNVCLHRGNRIKNGAGASRELSCRYHGWTWQLDGALSRIPDELGFHQLDTSCLGLRPVLADVWEGFVFINPNLDAEPLATFLEPIAERLAPYHFGEQTCTRSVTMPIRANWKTVVDGFLEVYHIHRIHPQLLRYLDDVNTTYDVWGRHSAMYMPMGIPSPRLEATDDALTLLELAKPGSGYHGKLLRKSPYFDESDGTPRMTDGVTVRQALIEVGRQEAIELGRDYSALTDDQMVDDHHYFFFPNIICNIDAGHFIASRIRPDANDPEMCYFDMHIFDWLTPEEKASRPPRVHQVLDEDTKVGRVPDQDFTQLPKVQLGMHADVLSELLLSDQECRVLAFHEQVDRHIYGERHA
jgi:phenylpropionate dioxygenase-like ring-hydroxylating dioxygenase large terminal subunit